MPLYTNQPLLCMICGTPYETDFACVGGYGRAPGCCSKPCFDELELRRARAIMGKSAPENEHPPCWDTCEGQGLNGGPPCGNQCEEYVKWLIIADEERRAAEAASAKPDGGDCDRTVLADDGE